MTGGAVMTRRCALRGMGAVAILGALAGCGPTGTGTTAEAAAVTLSQWYHDYPGKGAKQAAVGYAAAYPAAKVAVRWVSKDYVTTLSAALLSDTGPDVFEGRLNIDLVRRKEVVALDETLGTARGDFTDASLAANTVDGRVYGIPMVEDMQLLYYRKSLLAAAHVAPPTTLDELAQAAKALTTKTVKGLFVGNFVEHGDSGTITPLGGPLLWSAGLDLLSSDGHSAGFDNPRAATAIGKLRSLYRSGHLLVGAPTDWSDPGSFVNGLAAMQWSGLGVMPAIQAKFGDDFGVLPFPGLDGKGDVSVPITTYAAMVSAGSSHQSAARDFVKWLWIDQLGYQRDFNLDYGFHLPPRMSVATRASALKSGPAADAVSFAERNAHPAAPPLWTPVMNVAYQSALANIVTKGHDAGTELATAAAAVKKELNRISR